jgi:exonuclease VII small subunit
MELEKFEQAKKIKENLEKLERQKYKLEAALKSCRLSVTVEFTHSGAFPRKDEVSFYHGNLIKEMIVKELEIVTKEIESVEKEFEKV